MRQLIIALVIIMFGAFLVGGSLIAIFLPGLETGKNLLVHNIDSEEVMSIDGVDRIEVESINSEINFIATDEDNLKAYFHGKVSSNNVELIPAMKVQRKGHGIEIKIEHPPHIFSLIRIEELNLDVYVPRDYSNVISVEDVSGDIEIKELKPSELIIHTVSGDLQSENIGSLTFKSTSGDLEADAVRGAVEVNTVSGESDISFSELKGLDITTVSGDVKLRIPPDAGFKLNYKTISGDFSNSFPLSTSSVKENGEKTFNGEAGDGSNEIRIKTVSGDLGIIEV